jgi:crotonobetainyl-CoA:carnitine CoA-transferase CaiB-like acyl-CoA transferase
MAAHQILHGIRVIDMTQYLSGPTVTRLLAEHGADVIKIEQPPHGDPSRTYAISKDGRSGYFVQQNRGKRGVCVDFDEPAGREVLERLIAGADVVVENYGPGVLERRGLDWKTLTERHPRLIVASISGFGRTSALSHKTAFDLIAQAYSGLLYLTGEPDGSPIPTATSYADVMAGVHAVAGIALALFHRERTGVGQHVDISMVDSLFHAHELAVQGPSLTGGRWRAQRSGPRSRLNSPMGVYPAADGHLVLQVMQAQWPGFCRAMGRADLISDERFADLNGRQRNRDELNELVTAWLMSLPGRSAALERLEAERVPCAPVLAPHEASGHPYFESRRAIRHVTDPVLGDLDVPGNPLRLSAQPGEPELVAPRLGEHNMEVLREAGYHDGDIEAMQRAGILRSGPT